MLSVITAILYSSKIQSFDIYRILILALLLSTALGIHGISHLMLEKEYGYDPLNLGKKGSKDMQCPCMKGTCPCMKEG
jgi:hypothetical protein